MIFANLAPIQLRFFTFFWPVGSVCIFCLMLHEVLLSFCSLICHYEGIHTSSPKRRRFPVANSRWSCAFDVTRSPAFILFFNLSLRRNSHFLTLEKTFSSGQQSATNMRSNVIVQSGCPSEQYPHLKGFLLTWMTACARNSQTLLKWAGQ